MKECYLVVRSWNRRSSEPRKNGNGRGWKRMVERDFKLFSVCMRKCFGKSNDLIVLRMFFIGGTSSYLYTLFASGYDRPTRKGCRGFPIKGISLAMIGRHHW